MNVFKSKGIILGIKRKESEGDIYIFFSFEFGKILVQKNKKSREKSLDIWYIINCEIETDEKRTIHRIKNIKIKYEFNTQWKDFSLIFDFLWLIALIKKLTPDGLPIPEIYQVYSKLYKLKEITYSKLLLAKLKILNIHWLLWDSPKDIQIKKIVKFIRENNVEAIYRLQEFDTILIKKLQNLLI